MSCLKERIASAFVSVGHPPLGPALLSQVAALSTSLRIGPDQLAEAWEAHSLTKKVDILDDATFAGYRGALAKEAGGSGAGRNVAVMTGTGLGKRKPGTGVTPSPAAKRVTTAAPHDKSMATPGAGTQQQKQQQRDGLSAVDSLATPSGRGADSPSSKQKQPGLAASVITPPKTAPKTPAKYSERSNSGQLVTSYNPQKLPTALELLSSKPDVERERIAVRRACTVSPHPLASHPRASYRHMFTPLERRSGELEDRLNSMSEAICETYKIKSEEDEMIEAMDGIKSEKDDGNGIATWVPVGVPKQNKALCVGRICNEAHEGRLNRASIRLEGSRRDSNGSRVHLDLQGLNDGGNDNNNAIQSYSLFPGQIVAVEGVNSSGRVVRASRLFEGAASPQEMLPVGELLDYHHGSKHQDGRPLSIVSVCGPYTTRDNLDYDPLVDAVLKVAKDRPDVVIMCGPFVDGRHPQIADREPTVTDDDGNERKVSYEHLFANKVSTLLEEMYMNDPSLKTQFVLVPSMDDAFLDAVYPQPPLEDQLPGIRVPRNRNLEGEFGDLGLRYIELAGREDDKERPKRIHCASNPCTLQINDITVGVTSADVLFHISSDECNADLPPGTRLTRIAGHLVEQRSYYPLFPAANGASLDLSKSKEWEMPVQPDLLIVPSKLASFVRVVSETTVAVNPGELAKGMSGGTYAVLDVHPMCRGELEEGVKREEAVGEQEMMQKAVQDRVRVDIRRI